MTFDVPRLLDDNDIEYDDRGEELWALCPNPEHNDHQPSWSINSETGMHHCFSCGYGGGLITLLADLGGRGDWTTLRLRATSYRTGTVQPRSAEPDSAPPLDPALLASFPDPPADALARRHLQDWACSAYAVHYDDGKWILPIREGPNFVGWQVKVDIPGGDVWNHPTGTRTRSSVFGLDTVDLAVPVTVVESPLDAVRLHGLGIPAVSTWGAGTTHEQVRFLQTVPRLVLAYDNDPAGARATTKLITVLAPRALGIKVFAYGDSTAKDPGDMTDAEIHDGMGAAFHASQW